jgi:hypothetical protein
MRFVVEAIPRDAQHRNEQTNDAGRQGRSLTQGVNLRERRDRS